MITFELRTILQNILRRHFGIVLDKISSSNIYALAFMIYSKLAGCRYRAVVSINGLKHEFYSNPFMPLAPKTTLSFFLFLIL